MKASQLTAFGLDHLEEVKQSQPEAGPGQAVVQLKAASINYRDFLIAQGFYNPNLSLPVVPLSDGAGEVVAVGEGVSAVRAGDRVTPTFFPKWISGPGSYAEKGASLGCEVDGVLRDFGVFDAESLVKVPAHLSDAEAACFPCAGVTAWHALTVAANIKAGDTVLAMGTGGVALFAIQFAKALGATPIVISSSDDKIEKAKALGAEHGVNYKDTPEWGDAVMELTGGTGVDAILELGGAETLPQSLKAVAFGGHIALIWQLTGVKIEMPIFSIMGKTAHVHGITVGSRADHEAMMASVAEHKIKPVVHDTYAFDEAPQEIRDIGACQHFGKMAVQI